MNDNGIEFLFPAVITCRYFKSPGFDLIANTYVVYKLGLNT